MIVKKEKANLNKLMFEKKKIHRTVRTMARMIYKEGLRNFIPVKFLHC